MTKSCPICCSEVSGLKVSPTTCSKQHGQKERACSECWEAHLSFEVETKDPRAVECIFCPTIVSRAELRALAFDGSKLRYDLKLHSNAHRICQDRCPQSLAHGLQTHNRTTHGRVFACQFCHFATCIDCDRPEHAGESCWDYKTRVVFNPQHLTDEAATRAKFKTCPQCDVAFVLKKGCGYVQCDGCGHRFCSHCMISWVGEGSAYLGGKRAHFEGCKYRTKAEDSDHTLKRRFEEDEETKGRVELIVMARERNRDAKKARKAAKSDEGGDDGVVEKLEREKKPMNSRTKGKKGKLVR